MNDNCSQNVKGGYETRFDIHVSCSLSQNEVSFIVKNKMKETEEKKRQNEKKKRERKKEKKRTNY